MTRNKARIILDILAQTYPDAKCALVYSNPFELLVATILSAQCTDERVNMVTARLFAVANTPTAIAALSQDELESYLRSLGLFRNKAKNIKAAAQVLVLEYDGTVPAQREALESLPGVGRKTASVVLSNAFNIPALAVDTHVYRVATRLKLTEAVSVEKVELDLLQAIPRRLWSQAHHWLIYHGRRVCHARNPACEICPLRFHCPTGQNAATSIINRK